MENKYFSIGTMFNGTGYQIYIKPEYDLWSKEEASKICDALIDTMIKQNWTQV